MSTDKNTPFYRYFFGNPPVARRAWLEAAGLSYKYVTKQAYVKEGAPTFKFLNALKLDRASNGLLSVWEHGEGAKEIDLTYLRRRIDEEQRARNRAAKAARAAQAAQRAADRAAQKAAKKAKQDVLPAIQ